MADVDIVRAKVAGIGQQLLRLIQTFGQRLHCVQHRRDLLFVVAGLGEVWCQDQHRFAVDHRSEEHTSELQSLMPTSYAVLCLKKKTIQVSISNSVMAYRIH